MNTVQYSPLVEFALSGLLNCWMPDKVLFSFRYKTNDPGAPNQSNDAFDPFYTLNVLLGFSKLEGMRTFAGVELTDIFSHACSELMKVPDKKYAFGTALWAGAELNFPLSDQIMREIRKLLDDPGSWEKLAAQDIGMLLSGCVAYGRRNGGEEWLNYARNLKDSILLRYCCGDSGLFYNNANGFRRRFASFATGTYLSLGLFHYGEWQNDQTCIDRALRCVSALMGHQGKNGEWPWFYHAPSGRVVDMYEVYSVHQDGMAPAILHHAVAHGLPGAKEALERGFEWILGKNQLGRSMLVADSSQILRSQLRKSDANSRRRRALRAIVNGMLGRSDGLVPADKISVRQECRSYHLGWVIWSFGGRDDYPELTHHPAISHIMENSR